MANNPQWVRGHLGSARAVASGQAAVTFDTMTNVTLGLKKEQSANPTSLFFRTLIPCRFWARKTAAIFKDAPHPNAAKALHHLVSWAKEQQKPNRHLVDALGRSSTVRSQGRYSSINLPTTFAASSTNEKLAEEMRKAVRGFISASRKASR